MLSSVARVIAVSRRPFSLDVARQCGAAELVPMDDHWAVIERVKALTGGEMSPRVIEVVGAQWPLDLAGELTAVRGRLVIAGYAAVARAKGFLMVSASPLTRSSHHAGEDFARLRAARAAAARV